MVRAILSLAFISGSLLVAEPALAKDCSRKTLKAATDSYIAAQTKGDPSLMALASPLSYSENMKPADMTQGVIESPQKIDLHRSLLDTESCQTFTEVVITDPAHPYVIGTRLKLAGGKIAEIESLVTDAGDWLFSAANTLKYSSAENWDKLPKSARSDRATLIAAANAYFDLFNDKSVNVPWGTPCARLEGGLYTGKGEPTDSCNVGVPSNVEMRDRRFIVDEEIGAVVGLLRFGGQSDPEGLPDSHLFRLENGKIRYIHTITVCSEPNCGFPLPKQLGGTAELPSQTRAQAGEDAQSESSAAQP